MNNLPPKYLLRFFRWFCNPLYAEDIEGDLLERYEKRVANGQRPKANRQLAIEIFKLFRPGIIRPLGGAVRLNYYGLFRHNLLMTFRVLKKERSYTMINVLGLSVAMASFFAILLYVTHHFSYDSFHDKGSNIYRITTTGQLASEEEFNWATTPPVLAPYADERLPEIQDYTRVHSYFSAGHGDLTIASERRKFRESKVLFVDPSFLNIFSFEVISGNPLTCLKDVRKMVVTRSTAEKYFGQIDVLGEIMTVDGASDSYTIEAVVEDPPENSHLQFDFLISYATVSWWYEGDADTSWHRMDYYTYFELKPETKTEEFITKINDLYQEVRGEYMASKNFEQHFNIQPIDEIHFSNGLDQTIYQGNSANKEIVYVLLVVGWLIMIMAWVNFTNLSMARISKRATEVGVRKTLGAHRYQLFGLFILESLLIHIVSFAIAMALLFLFHDLIANLLGFSFSLSQFVGIVINKGLWLIIISVALFLGLYPVIQVVGSKNAHSRGNELVINSHGNTWFKRSLIVFQFAISVLLIVGTLIVHQQLQHMRQKDIGFDQYNKLVIQGPNLVDEDSHDDFKHKNAVFINTLKKHTGINHVTTAHKIPGQQVWDPVLVQERHKRDEAGHLIDVMFVGLDFIETMNMSIKYGSTLKKDTWESKHVIFNETAASQITNEPQSLINQTLLVNSKWDFKVVGIVEDFHQNSPKQAFQPLFFWCDPDYVVHYVVNFEPGKLNQVLDLAESELTHLFPRDPFDYFLLDDMYARQYAHDAKLEQIITLFSNLAILIACLGLIGLATYNVVSKVKEIGIRKTFGATIESIIVLLSKETILLVLLANLIAWPLIYFLSQRWLEDFAYRIEVNPWIFFLAGSSVLLVALVTVSSIAYKAASANPINSLRDE